MAFAPGLAWIKAGFVGVGKTGNKTTLNVTFNGCFAARAVIDQSVKR